MFDNVEKSSSTFFSFSFYFPAKSCAAGARRHHIPPGGAYSVWNALKSSEGSGIKVNIRNNAGEVQR